MRLTACAAGAAGASFSRAFAANDDTGIALIVDPADKVATSAQAAWAIRELTTVLSQSGIAARQFSTIEQAPRSRLCVIAAGADSRLARTLLQSAGIAVPATAESLSLASSSYQGMPIVLASGRDVRGLMYALLELADRVRFGGNAQKELRPANPVVEEPFNEMRSVGRLLVSEVEDKPWFHDREMWPAYFSMLAFQRFNCFSLNLGIGFDTLQYVTDSYCLFAYPFFLNVAGYNVRAVNLSDAERDRNLEMLQFISRESVAHGIDFRLGIWTHGYQWADTPHSNYTIAGLTPENHAAYSRDALAALLKACPDISAVTIRTHGESGVHEGSYDFWKTVFDGFALSGRKLEIDLHPKGLDQRLIDSALATGMPVRLSPKYWAEHMGLPYQQTAIRELEMPHENANSGSFYALSTGSRVFTRYGYADFLREDRPYSFTYRIWPGTHRFLLWGDRASAAAHARAFHFCGSNGAELYEPLSFKGRRGSGQPGGRCGYADPSLNPARDWEKYLYTYRVWGRLLYNPDSEPDVWRRQLRKEFPGNSVEVEKALGAATRIVPLVTTAHMPSAANDTYGPEFYFNQSIPDPNKSAPYGDTPVPKIFGNVSPLDPQLFARVNDFAAGLLKGEQDARYSPIEVAQWLEDLSDQAAAQIAEAVKKVEGTTPELRRVVADVRIQIGIGRFFSAKLRSATLYAIYEQSGDRSALVQAVKLYRYAREVWSQFAHDAGSVYVSDITYGPRPYQRGHWIDRLSRIDDDIATMEQRLASAADTPEPSTNVAAEIAEALSRPRREPPSCEHRPPDHFVPKQELPVAIRIASVAEPFTARLHYRHVNQAERYVTAELQERDGEYRTSIPASYTDSPYPIQYYFEVRQGPQKAWLHPGINAELTNQPYFVLRQARAKA